MSSVSSLRTARARSKRRGRIVCVARASLGGAELRRETFARGARREGR